MKHRITLTLITLGVVMFSYQSAYSWRVIGRTAKGGGFWGYEKVGWSLASYEDDGVTKTGALVNCSGPGMEHCPRFFCAPVESNPDLTLYMDKQDLASADKLLEKAYNRIGEGVLRGTEYFTLRVEGEAKTRYYKVEWNSQDKGALDSQINVYRDDR